MTPGGRHPGGRPGVKNHFLSMGRPGGAVAMPKPCCSTTPSINQMGAFKESYSTFEFRAFSLRPGGNPLWRSRCAGAGQRDCQKGFPSGNRAAQTLVLPSSRRDALLAPRLSPRRNASAKGSPRAPSGGRTPREPLGTPRDPSAQRPGSGLGISVWRPKKSGVTPRPML